MKTLTKHQRRFLKELRNSPFSGHVPKVMRMAELLVGQGLLERCLDEDYGTTYFRLTPLGAREAALPRLTPAVRAAFEKLGKGTLVFRMELNDVYSCFYEADGSLLNVGTFGKMQDSGLLRWEQDGKFPGSYIAYLDPEKAVPWN